MTSKPPTDATVHSSSDGTSEDTDASDSAFDRLLHEAAKVSSVTPVIAPGARLASGRFEIMRRIGEGGMGIVFEAFDTVRREKVALKTMSRMEARDVYQFKNEFRALADVSHENLVHLHELSADGELLFFTMELVEGERFDRWVRPSQLEAPDPERLQGALSQLVQAVTAIHKAGKLHRDLKPSNVLVTQEGRVVVLDFGLAIDPQSGGVGQTVIDDNVSGTPAYMAPEQAAGRSAMAASDWYAVGVMLFEALTGRLPFIGKPHDILVDKQRKDAPSASDFAPGVSQELAALCTRLLARDPSARPEASELSEVFPPLENTQSHSGHSQGSSSSRSFRGSASLAPDAVVELLGRDTELQVLRDAFEATLGDQNVSVFVSGESGMGKSALCEAFLHELRSQGRATVLSGRCYERENVPFKGFDSLVDDLSRHLRKLSREEAIAVLPRDVYALTRLFPVLGRVEVVAEAPKKDVPDPLEQRRRGYAAFGKLLARLRDRAPLCIHLDDVQWLDPDAVAFMRTLLVHPEPVPLLLLLSHRSENAESNPALLQVRDAIEGNSRLRLRDLSIGPLSEAAARDLAESLLSEGNEGVKDAAGAIARESGGSPIFVGELCRFVARHGAEPSALSNLSLQAALSDHMNTLTPAARRLLEHSALAGKPLPAKVLLQAAQATHTDVDRLRVSRLLRLSSVEGDRIIECYHDQVRETVADGLSELQRIACYAALASALDALAHPDRELLATCFEGAGQRSNAAEHYAKAAEQAYAGTAFLHAAGLYEKALGLGDFSSEREHALWVAQADALTQAGRGKRAAELFLRAAEDAEGAENRELRRRAAEELFTTGHAEQGFELFRELFREVGLVLPANTAAAVPRLVFSQLRLRLRGLDFVPRDSSHSTPAAPDTVEALSMQLSALSGLSGHVPMIAASVASDYLLRALTCGVPWHAAAGLGAWAYFLIVTQPTADKKGTQMLDEAHRIAGELGDTRLLGILNVVSANCLNYRGLWRQTRELEARALKILRNDVRDVAWWVDSAHLFDQVAAFLLGDWLDVASMTPNLIEQAHSRDRIWAAVVLGGAYGSVAWLSADDPAGYQRILERAKSSWRRAAVPQYPDHILLTGESMLHLYRDQAELGLHNLEPVWAGIASLLARDPAAFSFALWTRGLLALSVLRKTGTDASRSVVRDSGKRLARLDLPAYARGYCSTFDAGLALHARDLDAGAKHLRQAITHFEESEMAMHTAAARRRLGELIGGDEGKQLLAQGDATMHARRIVNLDAITEMLCAGCRAP